MGYGNFKQGFFEITKPEKYIGNNKPFFRSSWELKVMNFFQMNDNVIAWSSEKHVIPYKLPIELDGTGKLRRYFVDFYCEVKQNDGSIKKFLVEVKPLIQSIKPELPKSKRITKAYKHNSIAFVVNHFKWSAAMQYCISKGYEWKVITEQELNCMNIK